MRPWRINSICTQAISPETAAASTSTLPCPASITCSACNWRREIIRSRCSAAFSNCSSAAQRSISCSRSRITSSLLPSSTRSVSCTSRRYSSSLTSPTQGPVQRLIWYCRQGRERLRKKLSSHWRTLKVFCRKTMFSRTTLELG